LHCLRHSNITQLANAGGAHNVVPLLRGIPRFA
jgi:hypothetical protein